MERLIILTLQRVFEKLIVSEKEGKTILDTTILQGGNSRLKRFCKANFINIKYLGGNKYEIV